MSAATSQNSKEKGKGTQNPKGNKDVFTEVDFKFQLRDANTTFSALQKFIDCAERYPEQESFDIVGKYLKTSEECLEIFKLFGETRRKPGEILTIFSALECILIRLGDDGEKNRLIGENIVNQILASHLPVMYFGLSLNNKNQLIKKTLRLLTRMVAFSSSSARAVQLQFDFTHANIQPLSQRRDIKDSQDVRTCFIHFILAFLVIGDDSVVKQMVEQRVMLQRILTGITSDKAENIQIVLSTLLDRVVRSSVVSKTSKIHLFAENILKQLSQLYFWQGPQHWKEAKKKSDSPKQKPVRVSKEERDSICETVHTFLLELCCSFKTGINFFDPSLGTSGKNQNHVLTGFLSSLQKSSTHSKCTELVVNILRACPDQLAQFLSVLVQSLNPRPSSAWMANMDLLIHIYEAQPTQLNFLSSKTPHPEFSQVSMALVYILPPEKMMSSFSWGLKQVSRAVRHKILHFLKLVLQRTGDILTHIRNNASENGDSETIVDADLHLRVKEMVIKSLPDGATLLSCWNKMISEADVVKDKQNADLLEVKKLTHMVLIEQVLCLYQDLVPSLLSDNPQHVSSLLEGIRGSAQGDASDISDQGSRGQDKDSMLAQLYVLKLLTGTDARQLPWTKQTASKHTLMYLLLEMVMKVSYNKKIASITRHLVVKLLQSTGLFENQDQELFLWLQNLSLHGSDSVLEFCAKIMTTFVGNPYPHTDRAMEMVTELAVGKADAVKIKEKQQTDQLVISDILAMDLDEEWTPTDVCETKGKDVGTIGTNSSLIRLPFSPLTLIGLEMMKEEGYKEDLTVRNFLSQCLVDILHVQDDPMTYANLVNQSTELQWSEIQYIRVWLGQVKKKKWKKPDKSSASSPLLLRHLWLNPDLMQDDEYQSDLFSAVQQMDLSQSAQFAQQLLMYIKHTVDNLKGDDLEDMIRVFTVMLTRVVKSMRSVCESSEQETGVMEMSKEFDMLMTTQPANNNKLMQTLERILKHPTLLSMFLNEFAFPETSVMVVAFTEHIIDLLFELHSMQIVDSVKEALVPYADKTVNCMRKAVLNKSYSEDLTPVLRSVEVLQPFLDQKQNRLLVEVLLQFPASVLVKKKLKSLSKIGQLMVNVASSLLLDIRGDSQNVWLLPVTKLTVLMNLMMLSTDKNLETFCDDLLIMRPTYAIAVTEKLLDHVLNNYTLDKQEFVCIILRHNYKGREHFENWLLQNTETVSEKKALYSGVICCYVRIQERFADNEDEEVQGRKYVQAVGKIYVPSAGELVNLEDSSLILVVTCLVQAGYIEGKKLSKFWNHLLSAMAADKAVECSHLDLLKAMFVKLRLTPGQNVSKLTSGLVTSLLYALRTSVGSKDSDVQTHCLTMLCQVLQEKEAIDIDAIVSSWEDIVRVCLRALYKNAQLLTIIDKLMPLVYQESHDVSLPMEMLYEMLMSHSQFMVVMLEETESQVKESMVSLLLTLVELCPRCCDPDHYTVLQGAYTASLSVTDQRLLRLMYLYEKNNKGLADARPFLWGPKAIEHYALRKSMSSSLLKQPTMEQIVDLFDGKRMLESVLHFPLTRELQPCVVTDTKAYQSPENVYDPSFVLPLLCGLLSSDSVVDCRKFVSSYCVSYTLAALSSYDAESRRAAYTVLARYFDHLPTTKFHERLQVTYLLDTVRNSVEQPNERLSPLIAIFLAKVVHLFLNPGEHMYRQMNNFLLLKPSMDTVNVPEFYKLFNSSEFTNKVERSWILTLLADGLREASDYKIMERRFTFKMLQGFYDSAMSEKNSQMQILKVLKAACSVPAVAANLSKKHGILTWLSGAGFKGAYVKEQAELLISIIHDLWFTMLGDGPEAASLPLQFIREVLLCCKRSIMHIRHLELSDKAMSMLTRTILSCFDQMTESSCEDSQPEEIITIKDILLLLYRCSQLHQDSSAAANTKQILAKLGIHVAAKAAVKGKERREAKSLESETVRQETEAPEETSVERDETKQETDKCEDVADTKELRMNMCRLCLCWKPRVSLSGGTLAPSLNSTGVITIISWLLKQILYIDNMKLKTYVILWIWNIISKENSDIRESIYSTEFSEELQAGLLQFYNSLLSEFSHHIEVDLCKLKEYFSQLTETRAQWHAALSSLNNVVVHLHKHYHQSTSLSDIPSTELQDLLKTNSSASQELASLTLRQYMLGSPSHVCEGVGQTQADEGCGEIPRDIKKTAKKRHMEADTSGVDSQIVIRPVSAKKKKKKQH